MQPLSQLTSEYEEGNESGLVTSGDRITTAPPGKLRVEANDK